MNEGEGAIEGLAAYFFQQAGRKKIVKKGNLLKCQAC